LFTFVYILHAFCRINAAFINGRTNPKRQAGKGFFTVILTDLLEALALRPRLPSLAIF